MALGIIDIKSVSMAARLGSLGRTAKALNITQPALSRRISEAEAELGVKLFLRQPRGVVPTEECRAFLRHAEIALASIDDAFEAAKAVSSSQPQEVTLAFMDILCGDTLLAACSATLAAFNKATINFWSSPLSAQISTAILGGQAKIALRCGRDENPQLEMDWITDDAFTVVCAPTHPFANSRAATIHELEKAQWIGYPTVIDHSCAGFDEALTLTGIQGWKTWFMDSIDVRLKLLKAGLGVSLLRRAAILPELREGSLIELESPLSTSMPLYLTWRRGAYLGTLGEHLREQLRLAFAGARNA